MSAWRAAWGRVGLALLGIGAIGGIVHIVGRDDVSRVLAMAAPALPFVLLIEGGRIALESLATRALYGPAGAAIPRLVLVRAHFVGYVMTAALPAGRAMAETYKATALARFTSAPLAAAVGTANQALALVAVGVIAVPCAIAAYARTGLSALTVAICIQTLLVVGTGLGIQLASRSARLSALVRRISPKLAASVESYRDACTEHRWMPAVPVALHVAARGLSALGLGVLLAAVSPRAGLAEALVGQGITFVGNTAGDLVPFQLGATDGAWALAGPLLGLSAADAVGVALLAHAVQIVWCAFGALIPLATSAVTTARPRATA